MPANEQLLLQNQICFPLYVASRLTTQLYTPLLKTLDITYPQYLVLLVLWEKKQCSVSEISHLLYLESNTLTPLLKRLEQKKLIARKRSEADERSVIISLTPDGAQLQEQALCIPEKILSAFQDPSMSREQVLDFQRILQKMIHVLGENPAL